MQEPKCLGMGKEKLKLMVPSFSNLFANEFVDPLHAEADIDSYRSNEVRAWAELS